MQPLHIGVRRAGPLFESRERGAGTMPYTYSRQRISQIVRQISRKAGIPKRVYLHLLRHTMATKLLWLGSSAWTSPMCSVSLATRISRRRAITPKPRLDPAPEIDQVTDPTAQALLSGIRHTRGYDAALLAANLLPKDQVARSVTPAGA